MPLRPLLDLVKMSVMIFKNIFMIEFILILIIGIATEPLWEKLIKR